MKILHPILCYYPSQAGGPANTLYWLNNALSRDFESIIISTKFGVTIGGETKDFGERHTVHFLESKGKEFLSLVINSIKDVDIVQFSSLFFPPTLLILFATIRQNKAIIISPRGELYDAAVSQKAFKKKVWIGVLKLFQNKIHFHATNDFELGIIQKSFPKAKSTIVIPNFIQMPIKQDLDIKMNIVFVGRINPIKNIHILISAIAEVHKKHPTVKLHILGTARLGYENDYYTSLQEQIKQLELENVVFFEGHLDGDLKNRVIASSKALVLPSKSENFGNVVLEALAQGTPVIASKDTPWKLLEDTQAGFWTASNIHALTDSLMELLSLTEKDYQQMRRNAFELCKSKFNISENVEVWENYYKKITNNV